MSLAQEYSNMDNDKTKNHRRLRNKKRRNAPKHSPDLGEPVEQTNADADADADTDAPAIPIDSLSIMDKTSGKKSANRIRGRIRTRTGKYSEAEKYSPDVENVIDMLDIQELSRDLYRRRNKINILNVDPSKHDIIRSSNTNADVGINIEHINEEKREELNGFGIFHGIADNASTSQNRIKSRHQDVTSEDGKLTNSLASNRSILALPTDISNSMMSHDSSLAIFKDSVLPSNDESRPRRKKR